MNSVLFKFGLLAAAAFVLAGCATHDLTRKPDYPEEYNVPPDDPRFSQPQSYPKSVLNQDRIPTATDRNPLNKQGGGPGGGGRPGSGASMTGN